jgi:hypothetical protein
LTLLALVSVLALGLALAAGAAQAQAGEALSPRTSIALRSDPFVQLGEKLTALVTDESGLGSFGSAVAISADGSTARRATPAGAERLGCSRAKARRGRSRAKS